MKKILCAFSAFLVTGMIFAATMDSKVRSVPKAITEKVFSSPKEGLPLLVKHLTQGANGASGKVKVMHDWICDNIAYDCEMYFSSGKIENQDYESVLKKRKAVCAGYTSVMNAMCYYAGIESIGVYGYSKGFGYTGKLDGIDHAWNAIKLGGKWQLVDCTWDAGYVDYKTYVKHYTDEWLFLDPKFFIYSHLPEKEEYQYLKEPITQEQFVKEPYIAGKFFRKGFSLGKEIPDYTTVIDGAKSFEFGISQSGISITSVIRERKGGRSVENSTWINRTGNKFTVDFDVPDNKEYRAIIFAKKISEENFNDRFAIQEFAQHVQQAEALLAAKKITQREKDFFESAFFKSEENGVYYPLEDLFATERNNAVKKIFRLLGISANMHEPVLDFLIKASPEYSGYGNIKKYPSCYASYDTATSTRLIEPISGSLKKGEKVRFEISSKDYIGIAYKGDGNPELLKKDAKTGNFIGEFEIPDTDRVIIYGTKNNKNLTGLWFYTVE